MFGIFVVCDQIIDIISFNDTPCNTSHDAHEKVGKWIYLIGYVKKFARNHEHYLMLIIQNMGRRWWNMSVQKEKVDNVYARLYRSHYFLNTCFQKLWFMKVLKTLVMFHSILDRKLRINRCFILLEDPQVKHILEFCFTWGSSRK